jgi:hypothetical protein
MVNPPMIATTLGGGGGQFNAAAMSRNVVAASPNMNPTVCSWSLVRVHCFSFIPPLRHPHVRPTSPHAYFG